MINNENKFLLTDITKEYSDNKKPIVYCRVLRMSKVACVFHTREYDGELEGYYNRIEKLGVTKFKFKEVTPTKLNLIREFSMKMAVHF